ncbi:hypothetical protein PR003_g3478 [Phytophthora rubi]|uniref:Uncharacterized protein n=1 Tax=Phytophthora rubi TaxID=129364 RepID=A0A6A3NJ87_9STRA|nr:hypothetical protein PR002_g3264 [Phytophthora rubi]KAE9045624.1 hypothetical protein PR001_g4892 [Phytophthora rubi]KAE9354191.1 hypothetical protein PR003_g3478 [Phytophthora rubi]
MALLARTFRTVVGLPWSTFELLDRALRRSAEPTLEDPTSEIWAQDLFAPCSTKCWLTCSNDDVTDSSGSEMCDDEDEDEEDEWTSSESEDELDGFSFADDGDVDFWGDRWLWTQSQEGDDLAVCSYVNSDASDVDTSSYVVERLVDYAMPSMDPDNDAAIDSWIEKYGSSRSQVRFVTLSISETSIIDSSSTGLFVAVL